MSFQSKNGLLVLALLVSLSLASARHPPKHAKKPLPKPLCPDVYKPVCGSDGRTYQNRCWLDKFSVATSVKHGRCQECPCHPKTAGSKQPVCSRDGRTFASAAHLECDETAVFAYNGKCKKKTKSVPCGGEYKPVCGTDGRSYYNICFLDRFSSATLKHKGRCESAPCNKPCNRMYQPFCGLDGETYGNQCLLECYSQAIQAYEGPCKPKDHKDHRKPVCGVTRHLQKEKSFTIQPAMQTKPAVPIAKRDFPTPPIDEPEPEEPIEPIFNFPKVCPLVWGPVCGVNGKTYANSCKAHKDTALVVYDKACVTKPPRQCLVPCTKKYDPVCGKDGTTYRNSCWLTCNSDTEVETKGTCNSQIACRCAFIYDPVCAVDSQTYSNPCMAGCGRIKVAYRGECIVCKKASPSSEYKPVCGKDGLTYKNAWEAQCKLKVYIQADDVCPAKKICCRRTGGRKVCGVNGKIYENRADADCASMSTQPMKFCQKRRKDDCHVGTTLSS